MVPPNAEGASDGSAKLVLTRLRAHANKQRLDTLVRLESACDALDRQKAELSFANIGRRCLEEFRKGPAAQSIKNDPGLKEYVLARRADRLRTAEEDPRGGARRPLNAVAGQIERIPDQTLRARMRIVYADSIELRKRLSDIQAALLAITPGVDIETLVDRLRANRDAPVSTAPPRPGLQVEPKDVEALRQVLASFADPGFLAPFGLRNDGKRVLRSKGVGDEFIAARRLAGMRNLLEALVAQPVPRIIDADTVPE